MIKMTENGCALIECHWCPVEAITVHPMPLDEAKHWFGNNGWCVRSDYEYHECPECHKKEPENREKFIRFLLEWNKNMRDLKLCPIH